MIELTDDQRRAMAESGDTPPTVVAGDTTYRLIREEAFGQVTKIGRPKFEPPEGIRRSRAAIRRDLPSLLRKSGKFICYRGDERVGIGDYRTLMAECNRRGFRDDEFVIALIGPAAGSEEEEEIDRRPAESDEEPS